jgi:hypothetical protein
VLPLLLPEEEDPEDDPDEEPDDDPDDVELPLLPPLLLEPLELLPLPLLPLPPPLEPLLLVPPELPVSPPPDPEVPEHATRSAATAPKPVNTPVVFTITFPFVVRQAT